MNSLTKDVRSSAFETCIRFINYEMIEGDICEFGVYTGRSLALLSYFNVEYYRKENTFNSKNEIKRRILGFDSFEGLPDTEGHSRWETGLFKKNHSQHPTIPQNEIVTPESILNFFKVMDLTTPTIIKGYYDAVSPDFGDSVALVHIDCDLYTSTLQALNLVKSKLKTGTLILFDDWFNYKGGLNCGEQKAFKQFLNENPEITATEFLRYATFCNAFVLTVS